MEAYVGNRWPGPGRSVAAAMDSRASQLIPQMSPPLLLYISLRGK
jgi:hypothetical protein